MLFFFSDANSTMLFNITAMKDVLGADRMVSQAKLFLLIKDVKILPDTDQRIELYQGAEDKARYLFSHFINQTSNDKWLSFDVTHTVNEWLQKPGELYR